MTAIGLGKTKVTPLLTPGTIIGCDNSPESVTLSGRKEALEAISDRIKREMPGTFVRSLRVDCAYHSGKDYQDQPEATTLTSLRSDEGC